MTSLEKPVDLRIRRTRRMLQDAFVALMAEKRFVDITVQDITERAMINRGTFYDHFADKHALMEYSLREWYRETLSSRLPSDFSCTHEHLGLLILTTCEFMNNLRGHCPTSQMEQFPLSLQTQITTVIEEILTVWFREAHSANRHDGADLAAAVTSWAIYGAALHWSQSDRSEPKEAFVMRVLPIILAGIAP